MRDVLRAWIEEDGLRICRDVDGQPQHLEYLYASFGHFAPEWKNHTEGSRVPCVETLAEPL